MEDIEQLEQAGDKVNEGITKLLSTLNDFDEKKGVASDCQGLSTAAQSIEKQMRALQDSGIHTAAMNSVLELAGGASSTLKDVQEKLAKVQAGLASNSVPSLPCIQHTRHPNVYLP